MTAPDGFLFDLVAAFAPTRFATDVAFNLTLRALIVFATFPTVFLATFFAMILSAANRYASTCQAKLAGSTRNVSPEWKNDCMQCRYARLHMGIGRTIARPC